MGRARGSQSKAALGVLLIATLEVARARCGGRQIWALRYHGKSKAWQPHAAVANAQAPSARLHPRPRLASVGAARPWHWSQVAVIRVGGPRGAGDEVAQDGRGVAAACVGRLFWGER